MTLTNAFSMARAGINSAQTGIDLASRNIAGATEDNYTKKIQRQSPLVGSNGQSAGLRQHPAIRIVDTNLVKDLRNQASTVENLSQIDIFLGRMELMFGQPSSELSIGGKLTDLRNAFERLSVTPNLATAQSEVVRKAEQLAIELNRLSDDVQSLRLEANNRISDAVDTVNESLNNISDLNAQIRALQGSSSSTADLEDQRDLEVSKLAHQMNVKTFTRESGQLAIMTAGSEFLLDQKVQALEFSDSPTVNPGQILSSIGIDDGLPGSIVAIDESITSGKIAGLMSVRDTLLPQLQDQLDALAFELAQKLSSISVSGQSTDLNLFVNSTGEVPNVVDGFSAVIAVNSDIISDPTLLRDGGAVGTFTSGGIADPSLPLAVVDLFQNNVDFSPAPSDYYATFTNAPTSGADSIEFVIDGVSHLYTMAFSTTGSNTENCLDEMVTEVNSNFTGLTASHNFSSDGLFKLIFEFDDGGIHDVEINITDALGGADAFSVVTDQTDGNDVTGLSYDATFEYYVSEMIGFQANQKADYANRLSFQEQLFTTLENRFTDESMVNIDEELASLVELQSAFTASARVLTTVQRALDELLGVIN